MKIGILFPGYGSQFVGMCKELYDSSRVVQEYFEEAANCLDSNVVKLCFASSDAEISKMNQAYPAIFLVSCSIVALLKQEGIEPHVVAGFNTGEFAALFAAQAMSFPDGLYMLSKYAQSYQEWLDESKDIGLERVSGISTEIAEALCKQIRDTGAAVHVSLHELETVHIISGFMPALERFNAMLADYEGAKWKKVSPEVGLHSPLMDPVVGRLTMYLEKVDFHDVAVPVVCCTSGSSIVTKDDVRNALVAHLNNCVLWPQVLAQFESCDCILEIGPGDSLRSYIQACYPNKQIISVNKPEDIEIVKSVCLKSDNPVEPIDEHI
jgi:[acyl-carrier-protein] S-malonyltransferase